MSDAQTASEQTPARRPPPIRSVGRPKRTSKRTPIGLSRNVKAAIDLMYTEALSRKDAAARVGIADYSLYMALRNPVVMKYWNEWRDVLRTSEGPRSIHKIAHLRDNAESERVQLDAAKHLDGGDKGAGVTVNVGVNIAPGYMVDVMEHQAGARQILNQAKSQRNLLTDKARIQPDDDRTP